MNYEEEFKKLRDRREELEIMQSKELQEKHINRMKSYIGKYFKYENCYNDEEKWFEYFEVVNIVPESVRQLGDQVWWGCICKKFTQLYDGEIRINMKEEMSNIDLKDEISYEEFIQAQKEILGSI